MGRPVDDLPTLAALGLLAYASADVAHHVLGHGAACVALGGRVESLSSIHVQCSLTGATIDLAGPAANLLVGALCLLATRTGADGPPRLLAALAMAFNLCWFGLQALFSAVAMTDDWAWPLRVAGSSTLARVAVASLGIVVYRLALRALSRRLAGYAPDRVCRVLRSAWCAAGALACATALADPGGARAVGIAAAQSMLLAIGILFVRPAPLATTAPSIERSRIAWIAAAAVAIGSIAVLGPG